MTAVVLHVDDPAGFAEEARAAFDLHQEYLRDHRRDVRRALGKYSVRWGRVSGATWDAWIVRDADGVLVSLHFDHADAVRCADRFARLPDVGGYL